MVNFYEGEIKDILPEHLLAPEVAAVSYALGRAMQQLQKYAKYTYMYADLKRVPETILDLLALELNTQYYDQTLPRDQKEYLVSNTISWYMRAGTPGVLNDFLENIFGGGWISEWFDYGGEPYNFKAIINATDSEALLEEGEKIYKQIMTYKNVRSYLESLIYLIISKYQVHVKTEATIKYCSEFYPRRNLKPLWLDGTWNLNGIYKLNDYRNGDYIDFYQTAPKVNGETLICRNSEGAYRVLAEANQNTKQLTTIKLTNEITNRSEYQTLSKIKTDIYLGITSNITIKIENDLWYLDGSLILDGSKQLDAEVLIYN